MGDDGELEGRRDGSGRGRPRQGRAVARHLPRDEEILKIAAEVFYAQGYEGTTLSDIAREAGIVKGSLYHYFQSKEDIYARLIGDIIDLVDIEERLQDDRPPDVRLAELVRRQVEMVASNPLEIGIISRHLVHMEGDIGEWARDLRRRFVDGLREIVEQGQRHGTFRPDADATVVAAFILGTVTALAEWYRGDGRLDVDEIVEEMTRFVLHGVGVLVDTPH